MMFRAILFVIFALFVAFAASWLAVQEGVTEIRWLGYRAEIDSSLLVVAITLLCIGTVLLDRLVRAIIRWPRLFSTGWQARRRAKGETALSLGFVALAAGDNRAANKQARRAEKLLDKGILTDLLVAQSSYASGDSKAASRYFKKLAASQETAYFGQLGLMRLHQQDAPNASNARVSKEAFQAAKKAFALDASSAEAAQVILKKALADRHWETAKDCLKVYLNHSGGQSDQEVRRARAVYAKLCVQQAQELVEDTDNQAQIMDNAVHQPAIAYCEDALRHCPDFVPAFVLLVNLLRQKGDKRAAAKVAAKAFGLAPHEDSLQLVRDTKQDNDGQFISAAMRLAAKSQAPDDGYLAVAQFAISAGIWASASQALSHISQTYQRHNHYYMVEAAIASGLDDDEGYQEALRQAASAPRAPHWQCGVCGHGQDRYEFDCSACHAPGQMSYSSTGQSALVQK